MHHGSGRSVCDSLGSVSRLRSYPPPVHAHSGAPFSACGRIRRALNGSTRPPRSSPSRLRWRYGHVSLAADRTHSEPLVLADAARLLAAQPSTAQWLARLQVVRATQLGGPKHGLVRGRPLLLRTEAFDGLARCRRHDPTPSRCADCNGVDELFTRPARRAPRLHGPTEDRGGLRRLDVSAMVPGHEDHDHDRRRASACTFAAPSLRR